MANLYFVIFSTDATGAGEQMCGPWTFMCVLLIASLCWRLSCPCLVKIEEGKSQKGTLMWVVMLNRENLIDFKGEGRTINTHRWHPSTTTT